MSERLSQSPEELIAGILHEVRGMPVRKMEELLDHGDGAVEPVLSALHRIREGEDGDLEGLWLVILLGELGRAEAAPALAEVILAAGPHDVVLPQAAAEALAKIGPPALPTLRSLLERGDPIPRVWTYAAVGWIRCEEAYTLLTDALEADREMADVVASAVADQGREEAIPLLAATLSEVEPWQRPEVEDAIRTLGREEAEPLPLERDWRLRYRPEPGLGIPQLTLAAISAIARHSAATSRRGTAPVRSVEEILAEPEEGPERCESCGAPVLPETGVPVCAEDAVEVALLQHRSLGEWGDELATEDLFELLDGIETEIWNLEQAGAAPRSRRAGGRRDDEVTDLTVLREGCIWLVERGVESVSGGRATLLAAAGRLAGRYGDPEGIVAPPGTAPVSPDVGRNDPCPCGSGRKYKRCCGDLSRAGGARGEREEDGALSSDVGREVVHRMLDRHYRTWPDEPVPALGGRTPREAAEEMPGRERVAALLRSFEKMEARKPPADRYDFGWLWEELGVEELR